MATLNSEYAKHQNIFVYPEVIFDEDTQPVIEIIEIPDDQEMVEIISKLITNL